MSKLTLSFKGQILKVITLLQGDMLIGSDPSCVIHIDSLAVQPQHARIETHEQISKLIDLGTEEGTYVNQTRISEHLLKNDDLIRIGKYTLTYTYKETVNMVNEPPPPPAPTFTDVLEEQERLADETDPRTAFLQIMNGANLGKTLRIHRAMTNLGKIGIATAIITRRNDGFYLSYLEGKQPPTIDKKPIGEKAEKLNDGDIIQVGNVKMQFYLG